MERAGTLDRVARMRESDHQPVAQALQHPATVAGDGLARRSEEQLSNPAGRSEFVLLDQPNRLDHVRKDDGLRGVMQNVARRFNACRCATCAPHPRPPLQLRGKLIVGHNFLQPGG
jgi:hypothetical protein